MATKFDDALDGIRAAITQSTKRFQASEGNINYASAITHLVDSYSRLQSIALIEELGVQFRLANGTEKGTGDFTADNQLDRLFGKSTKN
jgi:hypothetical protein